MSPDTISDLTNYLAIEPIPGRMLIRRCSAMNWLLVRDGMNLDKALNVALGFMVIAGTFAGYWFGASQGDEVLTFLLNSDRNVETVLNIQALEGLRESQMEDTIELIQTRVKVALKYDGIKAATLDCAREYQRKYCKTPCLGIP